ncbi:alpha/beta hydrolase [Paraconexibacter algicola]|uniref:alpha/beta hydrolase n=1 Tax=Paraconexibacter algicola TaxID=2133960 RepID=UPI0011B248F9|nr:hypothetical protein [Paraconexibacter algicola]
MGTWRRVLAVFAGAMMLAAAPSAQAQTEMRQSFDLGYELRNFAKTNERALALTLLPDYQVPLRTIGLRKQAEGTQILLEDGPGRPFGRNFLGNLCGNHMDGCAGDVRLDDWEAQGHGTVEPVLWTARNGSTISGHVWATKAGPAKRPGVVITNGSVQAPEELYWFAAQTLAKAGYVVLTWDPQGQGYSDTFGEGADARDGFPSQEGRPFFDGTEDALDFFVSGPAAPYRPRPSCTTGTDHGPKQQARVADGRNPAFNPYHALLDTSRIGLLGQSLGAGAVSYVGQIDPRVSAIVAMDNLRAPTSGPVCASAPQTRPKDPPLTKPALGLTNDYALFEQAKTKLPDPRAKQQASEKLSALGVDTGSLVVRGGTHFEGAFIPNAAFTATLRGNDLYAWYLRAWFDRYLKGAPAAERALTTDRWRADPLAAAVDGVRDGNQFSQYYFSRLDIAALDGRGRIACENLRDGCATITPDGLAPRDWGFLRAVKTPDGTTAPDAPVDALPDAGGPRAASSCRDTRAPVARITASRTTVTRRGVTVRGTARDRGCGPRGAGTVAIVRVSVARVVGSRCRSLRQNGSFGPAAPCARATFLPATGTTSWRFVRRGRLPRGSYRIAVQATDAAGRTRRAADRGSVRRLRVR